MKAYPYCKADAFTQGESQGNPASFLEAGEDELTPAQMQAFARQQKGFVCETVICQPSRCADRKLTYYSSECEVDFCGHGTVAAMYEIIRREPALMQKSRVTIETHRKGVLEIENRIAQEDAIYITAPRAQWLDPVPDGAQAARALGMEPAKLHSEYPMELIDAGLRTLIVPMDSYETTVSLFPDQKVLKKFCEDHGTDIVLIFSLDGKEPAYFAHTRVFAPRFGYLEDPATGSGNSAFANYLHRHGLWDGESMALSQGGCDRVFNTVRCRMQGENVLFGGRATLRISGVYYL